MPGAKLVSCNAEWIEDPPAKLLSDGRAGDALDHEAEQDVVRAGIGEAPARRAGPAEAQSLADELTGRPPMPRLAHRAAEEPLVRRVVGEPRRMPEEVAHRDATAVREKAGEPALDGIAQPQALLSDELEHDDGDERLRDAACPESISGPERHATADVREAAHRLDPRPAVLDEDEGPRASGRDDRAELRAEWTGRRLGPAAAAAAAEPASVRAISAHAAVRPIVRGYSREGVTREAQPKSSVSRTEATPARSYPRSGRRLRPDFGRTPDDRDVPGACALPRRAAPAG